MGIVGYEVKNTYMWRVQDGLHYKYVKTKLTPQIINNLAPIRLSYETDYVPGRIYISESISTRIKESEKNYLVNINTAYDAFKSLVWRDTLQFSSGLPKDGRTPANSMMNMFDNVIEIGEKTNIERKVLVQHVEVDKDGKVIKNLDEYKNKYATVYDKVTNISANRDSNTLPDWLNHFHEFYSYNKEAFNNNVWKDEELTVRKSDITGSIIDNKKYKFKGNKVSVADTVTDAIKGLTSTTNKSNEGTLKFDIWNGCSLYIAVRFEYTSEPIERDIYVAHLTSDGVPIPELGNKKAELLDLTTAKSFNPKRWRDSITPPRFSDYCQEYYKIDSTQRISPKSSEKSGEPLADGSRYKYINKGNAAKNIAVNDLKDTVPEFLFNTSEPNFTTDDTNVSDHVMVRFLYEKEPKERTVIVQHMIKSGSVISPISQYKNDYAMIGDDEVYAKNPGDVLGSEYNNLHELYTIYKGNTIELSKSHKEGIVIGGKSYKFIYGSVSTSQAEPSIFISGLNYPQSNFTTPITHVSHTSEVSDYILVRFIYEEGEPTEEISDLPIRIKGRLSFINTIDTSYANAKTTDGNNDVIYAPATVDTTTGRLTPFVTDAYPYIVRALRYTPKETTGSTTAKVDVEVEYEYIEWRYVCRLTCNLPHEHRVADGCYTCAWESTTKTDKETETFNYTVNYTFKYFNIDNLKIYRIKQLEVYDDGDDALNQGGKLFSGNNTITVNTSPSYNSMFTSPNGLARAMSEFSVTFSDKTVKLSKISASPMTKPTYTAIHGITAHNKNDAIKKAEAELDKYTHSKAASDAGLSITFGYNNDYVKLSGEEDMVVRNRRTLTQSITSATTTINLDSTVNSSNTKIDYTRNVPNYMEPSKRTSHLDFKPNYQKIPSNRENGLRILRGELTYIIDGHINVGGNNFSATDYTYSSFSLTNKYASITPALLEEQNKLLKDADVDRVNVISPISLSGVTFDTEQRVDHTDDGVGKSLVLQTNADFTIKMDPSGFYTNGYNFTDTRDYIEGYYVICNFDIDHKQTNGSYNSVDANTKIYIPGATSNFTAKPSKHIDETSLNQNENTVKIIAVAKNATDLLRNHYRDLPYNDNTYIDIDRNRASTNYTGQNQKGLLGTPPRYDIFADSYHAVYRTISSVNLGRMFDFAVTDCTDLVFKNVFRTTNTSNVNTATGNIYFSGTRRWTFEHAHYNHLVDRIGLGSPPRILPLGPNKHTNTNVVVAPKLGYRISFDLKTTGYMADGNRDNLRTIRVTPTYYYISKDGTTFKDNIRLFYQNASGRYIPFTDSEYMIYYRPYDGYRHLRDSAYFDNYEYMSRDLIGVNVSNDIVLDRRMMSTSNNGYLQGWYGEFKVPNSTIAVEVDNRGRYNINNPLKNGYLGVVFNIRCVDRNGVTLLYGTDDKGLEEDKRMNTSQWDYEGYLGFRNPGQAFTGNLKLEKGIWNINNSMYQNMKGTVLLYDIDNRAADDFQ